MNELLMAAIQYIDALGGTRKLELDRLRKLKSTVDVYKEAHQGSSSDSSLSTSSCSIRSASAFQ